jgi:hypothetical protein
MYKNMRSRSSLKSMDRSANLTPSSPTKEVVYEKLAIKRKKDPLIEREKSRVLQEKR